MTETFVGGASAAPLSMCATAVVASAVVRAARQLFTELEHSRRIDATALRNAMEAAFGASDASGAWNWRTAYDACEAATVLFLRRYGAAMRAKAASPAAMLPMLARITNLFPAHTPRSEESESLQQFSTPIGLAFVASVAAAITPADVVLEPSPALAFLPSSLNWPTRPSFSTSSPTAVPAFLAGSFPPSPQRNLTLPTSTTTSTSA
jgi:hypothetical protein